MLGGLVLTPSLVAEGGGVADFSASTYPVDETELQVVVHGSRVLAQHLESKSLC